MNHDLSTMNQLAILLKRADQIISYHLCRAALDLMALYNMNQLAIFK